MPTLTTTFNGQAIVNVLHVTKEFHSNCHWKIRAEFQTANGQVHKVSGLTTDSRMIDKWNAAIAEDDVMEIIACEREVLRIILNGNIDNECDMGETATSTERLDTTKPC